MTYFMSNGHTSLHRVSAIITLQTLWRNRRRK